jgi:hypothetical protein
MSAHLLFCYQPQRKAVVNWMHEIGAVVSTHLPQGISEPGELRGLEHITFVEIVGMEPRVPDEIWEMLRVRGAIILKIDDHWAREKYTILTQHLPGERHVEA